VRLKRLKGLAHDLAYHLDFMIWTKQIKLPSDFFETNILEKKDSFDEHCVKFFQQRLPQTFDFSRVENITVGVNRQKRTLHVAVEVKVNGYMFYSDSFSRIRRHFILLPLAKIFRGVKKRCWNTWHQSWKRVTCKIQNLVELSCRNSRKVK
jgi:hypothetical protein